MSASRRTAGERQCTRSQLTRRGRERSTSVAWCCRCPARRLSTRRTTSAWSTGRCSRTTASSRSSPP
eukprot:5133143-Prymnesium_polylepis.2